MSIPKISVIVPCYNLESYIAACITSLTSQLFDPNIEIIVCDDASTDQSYKIVSDLAARSPSIKVLRNSRNMGLRETMRRLFTEAAGDYLIYMDGDDLAFPGKLSGLTQVALDNPDASIIYHEVDVFESKSGKVLSQYCRDFYNKKYIAERSTPRDLLLYGIYFQASSVMFKRHHRLIETLDHSCEIILDYPLHLANAFSCGGPIVMAKGVLGGYRIHDASFGAITLRSPARRHRVTKDLLQAADHAKKFGASPVDAEKSKVHSLFAAALYFLKRDDLTEYKSYISESRNIANSINYFFDERHDYLLKNNLSDAELRDYSRIHFPPPLKV